MKILSINDFKQGDCMKKLSLLSALSIFISIATPALADDCDSVAYCSTHSKNLWQPRPFLSYGSREIVMLKDLYDHPFKHDEWDGTLSLAFEYMQNFNESCPAENLGAMPFWSGTNSMTLGTNDGKSDVDLYQFGMGNATKQGSITLNPKIQHVGGDLLLHFAQYKHDRGLYFKLRTALGAMMVQSRLCEESAVLDGAVDDVWQLYPAPANRYQSLSEAFAGGSVTPDAIISSKLHRPLALDKGKISCCKLTSIKLGDISPTIGYNIFADTNYYFGVGIKAICPTGTVPQGEFIFEPVFGNGGHWGIGLEMIGHSKYTFARNQDMSLNLWVNSSLTHLTNGRKPSWRSFDLKQNGLGSKYMLVQFYLPTNPSAANNLGRTPSYITQAVNITTLPVLSSFSLEGALSSMVEFSMKKWNVALSFDLWGRTKELLKIDTCNMVNHASANLNDFAVLGRQVSEDDNTNDPSTEPLYYCEPLAQIGKSQDRVLFGQTVPTGIKDARITINRIPSNLEDALDIEGAMEKRSISGKIMMSAGYSWLERHYSPCINIFTGFEVSKYDALKLNMWSVGIQGALNF